MKRYAFDQKGLLL